ncbi:aldo/keto reductase [Rhizobium sp. NRK18]|uniref:aldo/keto reductase n=1 Tax=Rhizobium sp. NRK18 TaxID=2964667 RepID=UPI0021C3A028|nr:aldo/keto reductase [Rhizobium sp. NRK18]MCQ2005659.1 aldo/keto reductase [Rhizobium sp. NRK18]
MQYRDLGRTGIRISPIVFGGNVFGWTADEQTSFSLLDAWLDAGFNAIDTADVYSAWVEGHSGGESEDIIGRWMKAHKVAREKAVIVTKVGHPMWGDQKRLKEKWILQAAEDSLRRLQTDYIDVYLAHFPDKDTPYEETLGAMAKLKEQGKIRSIGASNLDADQLSQSLAAVEKAGLPRYDVLQPEYNLHNRSLFEGPLAELCVKEEIGVISFYALAAGFLTGKYRSKADTEGKSRGGSAARYLDERGFAILGALDRVAEETGAKPAEISIAWLLRKRGLTAPIASATSKAQLDSIVNAAALQLTDEQMRMLDEAG